MKIAPSLMFDFNELAEKLKQQIKDKAKQQFGNDNTCLAPPQLSSRHRLFGQSVDTLVVSPTKFITRQSNRLLNRFSVFNAAVENANQAPAANINLRQ